MPLHPQAKAFIDFIESLNGPNIEDLPVDKAREVAEQAWGAPPSGITELEDIRIPGPAGKGELTLRIYRPRVKGPLPVLVWIHGGGWVLGTRELGNHACEQLATRTPCIVASVEYGLSPENAFPGPIDDAFAAFRWVSEHAVARLGARPGPVAVGGDSAGGHLSLAVALRARDAGIPVALQLLVYPVADGDTESPSYLEFAQGFGLTKSAMDWFWDHFVGEGGDRFQPEASLLRNPRLAGAAPAFVLTAECDVLRDEGEALAAKLKEAGVPVELHREPGQLHGFFTLRGMPDEATGEWVPFFDATATAHQLSAEKLRAAFGTA